jgi:hypothetical protein
MLGLVGRNGCFLLLEDHSVIQFEIGQEDLSKVLWSLLEKRPPTDLERQLARESHKSLLYFRANTMRICLELLMGEPLSSAQADYLITLAKSSLRRNRYRVWDQDLPLVNFKHFWRRATG